MPEADPGSDERAMRRALELAERGRGRTSPNPLVGCVIERAGRVLGEGWHAELGGPHAERAALADCRARGEDPAGSTMHVTLEPCAHHGRQPPCAEAVLEAGVARVVIAADDPTSKASGRGPQAIGAGGVEVEWCDGPLARRARRQNQPFRKRAACGRTHVVYKVAASLDARTSRSSGSGWISSRASRELVHAWRSQLDAVAVGVGTVLADDPLLTARGPDGHPLPDERQPLRVVFDTLARTPPESQLVRTADRWPSLLVCGGDAPAHRVAALERLGVEVVALGGDRIGRVREALTLLADRDLTSMLLEGGGGLAGAFWEAHELDAMRVFLAPILIGGEGPGAVLEGAAPVTDRVASRATELRCEPSGDDLLLKATFEEW